jgi:HEAT repeat protein
MEAFADLGEPAVEPLLELLDASAEDDRPDLVFLLATLGVRDERIQALIAETVASDPYEGALCAGLYGDPALKESVAACLENTKAGSEERKVLEECLAELDRERGPHEPEEFDILGIYPAQSMPLFDSILPEAVAGFFECEDPAYRARAAASFTDDEYSDEVRDQLFVLAETDAESSVRGAAWRALGERVDEAPIREHLMRIITTKQDDPEEWTGALIGLSGAAMDPQVNAALLAGYEAESTRAAALEAMWRSLDTRFAKYFGPNLRHEDLYVRRQAILGVGALPVPALAFELIPLFSDEEVREDAIFAYALAAPHNTTPKSVTKLYDMIVEKAGGMSETEEDLLAVALDQRLEREGYEPVFFPDDEHRHGEMEPPVQAASEKIGRNDPCPCGSGRKYKKCCGSTVN